MIVQDYVLELIIAPVVVAMIIGYLKLMMNSVQAGIENVAKDVRKSNERVEKSLDNIRDDLHGISERVRLLEIDNARTTETLRTCEIKQVTRQQ